MCLAAALASHLANRRYPVRAKKGHRILGQRHHLHGRRDLVAFERRHALAIPPRIELTDGRDERRRETHALRES
jgi:hypothetical protein